MSSTAAGSAGGSEDKPPRLSRLFRRASKVLRRGSSKRGSLQQEPSAEPTRRPAETIPEQAVSTAAETPAPSDPKAFTSPADAPTVPAAIQQSIRDLRPANPRHARTAAESSAIQEEKARALFSKYGLTLSPEEWIRPAKSNAERVEKNVRVRIRRTCHRCQTTYGADKLCSNCQHRKCKKCPRYPVKRDKAAKDKGKAIEVDPSPQELNILTIRSRRTGLAMAPKQKGRRKCHQCNELFARGSNECANCRHLRCPQCPREPPKVEEFPLGYPRDKEEQFVLALRERKKPRLRFRWRCHTCSELFIERSKTCVCGHERCEECPREPPKKTRLPPDEDVVRRVEEKLRAFTLSPSATAA